MKDELSIFLRSFNAIKNDSNASGLVAESASSAHSVSDDENACDVEDLDLKLSALLDVDDRHISISAQKKSEFDDTIAARPVKSSVFVKNSEDYQGEHIKHRDRVKDRFLSGKHDLFLDYEILEMVLFFIIPRVDVKPIASRMMLHFGSFKNLFNATDLELGKFISNVKNMRFFLNLTRELQVRRISSFGNQLYFDSITLIEEYLKDILINEERNGFDIVFLFCSESFAPACHIGFDSKDISSKSTLLRQITSIALSKKKINSIFVYSRSILPIGFSSTLFFLKQSLLAFDITLDYGLIVNNLGE